MNQWLRLRHAIVHGDTQLPVVAVLQSVRQNPQASEQWTPQIRLADSEACMRFFWHLAHVTGDALADHIHVAHPNW